MAQSVVADGSFALPPTVPLLVRFLGKLVLEVLPAALASIIGGVVFAHYQFGHPAVAERPAAAAAAAAAGPASAEMVALVRDEHAMIRDFLLAQAAQASRMAAADAEEARAAADAKLAAAAMRRAAAMVAAKPIPSHGRTADMAADIPPTPPVEATLPTLTVAAATPAAATPPPASQSLVASTLAIPGHVVAATLHAVALIGGIPSWVGNRLGSTPS